MLLFHGSKARFTYFDERYFRSGEGVGTFKGWYFIDSLKGACKHVESYLRHINGAGLIYVCYVPDEIAILDCESGLTDSAYHGQSVGVKLSDSHNIGIVEVLPVVSLTEEVMGPPKSYYLENTKAPLIGGELSYLRRSEKSSVFGR